MTNAQPPEEILINDRALNKLIRSITLSQGNFSMILARCNYGSLRDRVVQQLKAQCPITLRELYLPPSTKTLYTTIRAALGDDHPQALMIFGLEQVEAIDHLLISTNQVREEFRKNFPFPIVLWVNDHTLKRFIQLMPDFKSWTGNSIKFELTPTELVQRLHQPVKELFEAILAVGEGRFLPLAALYPQGAHLSAEWEPTLLDLPLGVDDRLRASLQFWAGREADLQGEKAKAKADYEQSLAFWQAQLDTREGLSAVDCARYGCVLFHLGLWWRQYATQHRAEYKTACSKAKEFYQQSLAAFDRTDQPELAAKFINALGEVLTRLGQWDELATVAQRAVQLHQTYSEPIRLAFAYGLLAEVALQQQDWSMLKAQAELALQTNELPSSAIDWSLDQTQRKNLYLLLLAQAQRHHNQSVEAVQNLETAQANFQPQYDPTIYIRILETLQSLYFEQGQYLQAFETKQEQRSIEQQYGLRAFVGAGRLQSRRQVINPALATTDAKTAVTQEIAASGRLLDVNRLLERIGRTDHKLTVIYGQSGVGKSSLVQAGLVPALKQRSIEARDVVPVLLQVYTDWSRNLGDRLAESLQEVRGLSLPLLLDSMAAFVTEIQKSDDKNLLTVLIFDQFEEFFFAYKDPTQRRPFFEFLRDCLNVPYVKVILSLREDYLHYLLECNRLTHLDVIDNNILDKKILYHLGNFSPEDSRAVIQSLTDACQFHLESALIDELVQDLAGELQEVRPIELQVVGAQMQTEQVMTLAHYQEAGPKERFVGRFLEEVVTDCGTNNEQFAKIILYLLTDDNLTRPLKTRAELEADLAITPERLNLILNILVKSGLVFQVPGFPAERYQLVHDYLVPFVRQQQAAGLVAELEKEREQRKLTEEKLNQALKQQLRAARRGILTLAGLAVLIGGTAIVAIIAGINLYISNQVSESSRNNELDRLVSAIKAGKTLKTLPVAIREVRFPALIEINNAIANLSEQYRLEGHTGAVTRIVFSPHGQFLASISDDQTAKVWQVANGQLEKTLQGGQGKKITSVSFSPDDWQIATSEDQAIKIWTLDGKPVRTLRTWGTASSISFSPDQETLAASIGRNVIFWNLARDEKVYTHSLNAEIASVSFSHDGNMIAIADQHDNVQIFNLKTKKTLSLFDNYGTINIQWRNDDKKLILTNKDGSIKYYNIDGTLVKNVEGNSNDIKIAALSPDSKLLAFIDPDSRNNISLISTEEPNNITALSGHKEEVTSLSFSPDGNILASASKDKTIRLWKTGLREDLTHSPDLQKIQFSRDSQTILAARSDQPMQRFDQQGKLLSMPVIDGSVFGFSPDGQKIATGSTEDIIKLWSLGGQVKTLKKIPKGIVAVTRSPNGRTVVAIGNDDTLMFWRDGQLVKAPVKLDSKINSLTFSPDSNIVALLTKNQVQLWHSDGIHIKDLWGHTNRINSISFSPDSELMTTIGDDNLINLWRKDGTLVKVLSGHKNEISKVEFSSDSKQIASFSSGNNSRSEIKVWSRAGEIIRELNGYWIQGVHFSPDNKTIAVINGDKTIQLWDLTTGNLISTLPHYGVVKDLSFSPDGSMLVSASNDHTIRLWQLPSDKPLKILRGHSSSVRQVKFNPSDGQTIVSASNDGMVLLWKRDGTRLKVLQPADDGFDPNKGWSINDLQFSQDGKTIIFTRTIGFYDGKRPSYSLKIWSHDGHPETPRGQHDFDKMSPNTGEGNFAWIDHKKDLKLWNLQSLGGLYPSNPLTLPIDDNTTINGVSFNRDGSLLASVSDDQTVKVWDTSNGQLKVKAFRLPARVRSIILSPEGDSLASVGDDQTIKWWSQTGQSLKPPIVNFDKVTHLQLSPDGAMLAALTEENKVKLWQMGKETESIKTVENSDIPAFNPDNTLLATLDTNEFSQIRFSLLGALWDSKIIFSNQGSLADMQFSPDKKMLALATVGDRPQIVDFDLDRLLNKACNLARNYLSSSEKLKDSNRNLCDDVK